MRVDRRRYNDGSNESEVFGHHEAPSRQAQDWTKDVYGSDEDIWYDETPQRYESAYGGRRTQPSSSQPPRQSEEPWRDRGSRERVVRQVEVQPPVYRSRRNRKGSGALLIVLIVVLAGGMLFAGGKLVSIFLDYHRDRSAYSDLASQVLTDIAEQEQEQVPEATPGPEEGQTAQAKAPYSVDWDSLRTTNSDVVGWLICPDTAINYPVVQTSDNDFYLHRGFADKQPNTSGTLFADKASSIGITYSNYIIYGHNMKDGSMFAAVEDYMDPNFYEQHPIMYFLTPECDYTVELIAGHITESSVSNYPGYFSGVADYSNYLNLITSQSTFYTQFPVSTDYQLITLSTCNYSSNYVDPRYLLHGLLVPFQ